MALEFTDDEVRILKEKAGALLSIEKAQGDVQVAEAAYQGVQDRYCGERAAAEQAFRDALTAIDAKYADERAAALKTMDDARKALDAAMAGGV